MQTLTQLMNPDDLDAMGAIDGCGIPGAQAYPASLKPAIATVAAPRGIPRTRRPAAIRQQFKSA